MELLLAYSRHRGRWLTDFVSPGGQISIPRLLVVLVVAGGLIALRFATRRTGAPPTPFGPRGSILSRFRRR